MFTWLKSLVVSVPVWVMAIQIKIYNAMNGRPGPRVAQPRSPEAMAAFEKQALDQVRTEAFGHLLRHCANCNGSHGCRNQTFYFAHSSVDLCEIGKAHYDRWQATEGAREVGQAFAALYPVPGPLVD